MANDTLKLEGVKLTWLDFKGQGKYNKTHAREFHVILDREMAEELEAQGYNIRWPKPFETDEELPEGFEDRRLPTMKVTLSRTPNVSRLVRIYTVEEGYKYRVDTRNNNELDDLDDLGPDILYADIVINPYHWEIDGRKGISAYVASLYLILATDEFSHKYQ